tara:strand:+ start:291 stop:659 length:369 start_codon:yes stop_codon:yes gene_type:complete
MKYRAKQRENCLVYKDWIKFSGFESWALSNGYKDNLVICRNGDIGNYEPNNVRWDTQANNTEEALALHHKFLFKGEVVEIYNLAKYCRDNGLTQTHMSAVHNETPRQGYVVKSHKGYTKFKL